MSDLRKAIMRAEDGAGTLPAKDAVKIRPADWHKVCKLGREAADEIDRLTAALAEARDKALAEAEFRVTSKLNVEDPPDYTQGVLDAAAAIRRLKEKP